MRFFLSKAHIIFIFLSSFVLCSFSNSQEPLLRRVQAHVLLKNYQEAAEEAENAHTIFPNSAPIFELYIRTLAMSGQEKKMMNAWNSYVELFPEQSNHRELIESMAWGVLNRASQSSSLIMRVMAILAAFFSQDAQGVNILFQNMKHPNAEIRSSAVQLAGQMHDAKLVNEMKRLFKEEKSWKVRLRVIEALGNMDIKEMRVDLMNLITSTKYSAEEKALALEALVKLYDYVERREIETLTTSNRVALRLLAARVIGALGQVRDQDLLLQLVDDYHPEVRAAAIQSLGLLRPSDPNEVQSLLGLVKGRLNDPDDTVKISAAWLLTLYQSKQGIQVLEQYLQGRPEIAVLAASAIALTGPYGTPLALQYFEKHPDLFVRLHLALGLIGQRVEVQRAASVLAFSMKKDKNRWSTNKKGVFEIITKKSSGSKDGDEENSPEMANQLLRLELLNLLAVVHAPQVEESVREFLLERKWGITAVAAALLLMEGDDQAIHVVKELLTDSNLRVRIQAGLVLSLWGQDEEAMKTLEASYRQADHEGKSRILEGIGRIKSFKSVQFLLKVLEEESQTLRLIAAMAIIQCLN